MADAELTMEQKREKVLAGFSLIQTKLQKQMETAVVNAEKSQARAKAMYEAEKSQSNKAWWLKLILNFFAAVFLKVDHHFLNYRKDEPSQELKALSEKDMVAETKQAFSDVFKLLDRLAAEAKRSETIAESGFLRLRAIATNREDMATALIGLAKETDTYIRSSVREILEAARQDATLCNEIRSGLNSILYTAE